MVMPLIVGQEWRRRISRMQWLLNAVLAVECLSMPFFAAGYGLVRRTQDGG